MSVVPSEIPGFGSATLAPRANPQFAPGAGFTSEDYYVLSRCDGATTAREIVLMSGLGVERACGILGKLRKAGALLVTEPTRTTRPPGAPVPAPGSTRPPGPPARAPGSPPTRPPDAARAGGGTRPPDAPRGTGRASDPPRGRPETASGRPLAAAPATGSGRAALDDRGPDLGALSAEEHAALAASVPIPERDKRRIVEMMRMVRRGASHFELLGATGTTDRRELKRAYFRVSKEFHPDRWFGKALGPFHPWLTTIFERVARAYEVLSDDRQRAAYEAELRGERPATAGAPAGRTEQAAELFERACNHEHRGELAEALGLFAQVVHADPQARYLRRAALCAMAARELPLAEEYASKGAELRARDPAYARVLAEVQRAAGKLERAEATLVRALELPTENDVLVAELRADLAAVRAARTPGG